MTRTKKRLREATASQAPEDASLGQYAFPLKRQKEKLPQEDDTWDEESLYDDLGDHFSLKNKAISRDDAELIKGFLDRGEYKSVFHEPSQDEVFRGMHVSRDFIENIFGSEDIPYLGAVEKTFVYSPKEGGSSWTSDEDIARDFANDSVKDDVFNIVLHARVSDNHNRFIAGDDGFYKVDGFDLYTVEHEVIGLGKINVYKLSFV